MTSDYYYYDRSGICWQCNLKNYCNNVRLFKLGTVKDFNKWFNYCCGFNGPYRDFKNQIYSPELFYQGNIIGSR